MGAAEKAAGESIAPAPEVENRSDRNSLKDEKPVTKHKSRPEREAGFNDYFRIFTYSTKWDFVILTISSLAAVGTGVTLPLMNIVFGKLVGNFTGYFAPNSTVTKEEFEDGLNRQTLYLLALFLGRLVASYINKFGFRMIGIRMSAAIRLHYLTCLFGQTIHVLDSMPSGAAAGTITGAANTLQLGISDKLGTFVEFMATIIAAIVVGFTYNWALALVVSSVILFIFLVISIILPFIIKGNAKLTEAEGKASAIANETFGSIRMITACGAEERVTARYAKWVQEARKRGQATSPLVALQFGLIFFALYGAFGLCFWYGTKRFLDGALANVGVIIIVLMSVMLVVISLERISTPLLAAGKASVAACEFFTVIDAPRPDERALKEPDVSATQDIVFKGVQFAYPSRPHVKVLDDLDLHIEAGKLTAIVGPSGSGKSTIVGLIERWYTLHDQYIIEKTVEKDKDKKKKAAKDGEGDGKKKKGKGWFGKKSAGDSKDMDPAPGRLAEDEEEKGEPVELRGSIHTSGHNIDDINLQWWRSQIGLVQQEPFLFNDTIFRNVAYGLIGSAWEHESDERKLELVKEACKEAFADEFIDRLPDGYETYVGESGAKLSGGQRQRLAIARSIIKKPKILILDEATSAIDVRGERIVQAALDKVSMGRTTITIAHRLSTIKKADRIVVLQKGRVVESGTHESLLERGEGVYYGLVHAQQLSLGDPRDESDEDITEEEDMAAILSREKSAAHSESSAAGGPAAKWKAVGFFNGFGRLLYEQKSRFPYYVLTLLFAMTAAAASPLQAYLFAQVIVVFNAVSPQKIHDDSNFWSLMWLVLAIAVGASYFFLGLIATRLAYYIAAAYRQQYFESILFQKTDFFDSEENSVGTLTARVTGDPKQLEEMLGMNMAMVYVAVFTLIGAFAISFSFSWKLALVAICVTAPLNLSAGYYRFKYEMEFEKMYAAVFAESSKFAAEAIGAFRTVSALTLEPVIVERYRDLLHGHVVSAYKKARWTAIIFGLSDSLSIGCQALIFWYGGRLLATRELGVLNFFICYMAVIQGAEAAGNGLSFGPNMAQAAGASDRILQTRQSRNSDTVSDQEKIPDVEGGVRIELDNVHFRYPTRNVSVFKGLSLTVEKGQFAALVGASGCGKTSIISLLERFYDVQGGRILANGKDITDVNVYEYRKYLSLVAQEATIFQGTLRENILLGVDPDSVTDEQLHHVAREASIHDFIASLPDGYNTDVGSKGFSLSGGQKQRIAIARALVRNPRVLLLDEATSSLDSESEKLVQAAFERAAEGRTMVVVAHRLATVQNADIIFVLGEGKVLEKGSHTELLKKRGVYWHMCMSQALDR